ncbi:hypothetical protein [Kurthia sibirica]|nr:hypothetical protein [Kurthia sibirica]GEK33060.1 hypothetical protein KSI01_05930 [Kurthia sibirica]
MTKKDETNEKLKGTFYLSMTLGVFIVIVWGICFGIFMGRF